MATTVIDHTPTLANSSAPLSHGLTRAIRDGAAAADRAAELVACHDRMVEEGLFHLLVPRELGGGDGTARDWFDAALAVAQIDPSAGWIMAQGAVQVAWVAVAADPAFAAEFFATRQTIATSSAGKVPAERRDDAFVLRGARWAYTSGCSGADYLGGMILVTAHDGRPESRMAIVPAAEATIERTWDTLGLRGTGSHDVSLGTEAVIPVSRTFTWPSLTIQRPGTLARAIAETLWMISVSAAAVNLGAAHRAVEAAVASADGKVHRFDTVPVLQQSPFIRAIAELDGQVRLATAGVRQLLDELWDTASSGVTPTPIERARLRLAAEVAVRTGVHVTQEAARLVGADAVHRTHPLERLVRDTQMLQSHVAVSPSTREQLGRVCLGTYDGPPGFI